MVRNRWRTFPYADDLSRSHALIPAPHSDNLFELLHSFEDGMEPYDIELSQYIVLEDKVVCFVGTYRESFYNHKTGDYKLKKKRHWFGIAYQTSMPYSELIGRYSEARQNYDDWWAKMLIAEKLQMERFKKEGGDTIMPHHGMERNKLFQKEPQQPWRIFEEYMWHLDGRNWNRDYRVYDYFIEGNNKKDAKERILEQAQKFVSTEPDWFKNPRQEIFEKRRRMKKNAEESNNPSAEEILDFVIKQFSKGELTVNSKMIGEHFNIEPIEVQHITNSENVRDKYKVEGESAFGDFFLRYKEIPFQSAYNNGLYYASMKNPWVKARAIGRKYEPKQKRKARLKRILYGAEGIGSKGMLAAGIVVAFTIIPEIKKAFLNNKKDK